MISHETHPRDILIFDHTALAVAPASLLLSAILSFPFAAWGFHSSDHTTDRWLQKYVQKQNKHLHRLKLHHVINATFNLSKSLWDGVSFF